MNFEDIETFVEVAEAGSVSAAARRLGLAKSIVSRRLARLEEALGAQLLARNTRGAALTEAGASFRDHASRIRAEMDTARETISPSGELRGRLRLAAPLSYSTRFAPLIAEFARRHPLLHVQTTYSDTFVDLVGGGFDAGIRVGFLPDSTLVARKIASIPGYLVASPAYLALNGAPQSLADLLEHEALTQGGEHWRFSVNGEQTTIHPRGRFRADNGSALATAAVAGLGIAALPDFLVEDHITSGALTVVLSRFRMPEAGIYVVRPPSAHPSRKLRELTELLQEYCSQRPAD